MRPSFAPAVPELRRVKTADRMLQRIMINKMPSSMMEKAQSSTEPKAMGVKIIRMIRISLIMIFNIAQSSKVKAQRKN